MNTTQPVRGLWCATMTPLDAAGAIDHSRLAAHVRALFAQGVDGVAPFGTTGEGPSFSVAERITGLERLLAAGIPAARIVPGTGCTAFTDAVALTRHAVSAGCPRCLVLPPFFFKNVTDEAVFRYFATLIDAVADPALSVYLYHIPQFSGVPIRPAVVARLAASYPEIIAGVKDSGGDYANTRGLLDLAPQLSILVGHEPHLPRLMREGGAGTICGVANTFPDLVAPLLAPTVTADDEARIAAFVAILFRYPFLATFKAIRAAQTGDAAWNALRPPWQPLPEPDRVKLVGELRDAGFLVAAEVAS